MKEQKKILLSVRDLKQWFPVKKWFFEKKRYVKAVDGLTFDLYEGETLGIAGESGCGKSTMIRSALRLIEPTSGTVVYEGRDITHIKQKELKEIRKQMQIVFQDPYSSLDAQWKVGQIIEEPLIISKADMTKKQREERVKELMSLVGLDPSYVDRYPHEFSGGQKQRIVIASALATNPKLLMCDEAVSALDVSVRAQVLNLLEELQDDLKLTYVFVSHDLSVIEHICDRIAIMYLGKIIEIGNKSNVFNDSKHPYTKALLSAIPSISDEKGLGERIRLEGDVPSPIDPPSGCRFHTRCKDCFEKCKTEEPQMKDIGNGHCVACHLY